jgi:cytoskeletal protein CcmA (bactofilin family)
MADYHVLSGSTAKLERVEGELTVGRNARIKAVDGKIMVVGAVRFEGGAEVIGSLECDKLSVEHYALGKGVKINGDLSVHNELDVVRSLEVSGAAKAGTINLEGEIRARSASAKKIRASGSMELVEGIESEESVEVTGRLNAPGQVRLNNFGIAGQATIGGGQVSGTIQVRGKLDVTSKIDFRELLVSGTVNLHSSAKGKRVSSFGKVSVQGNISCDQIEVQGTTNVHGNCDSVRTWVRGKLQIFGSLSATESIDVFGKTEVSGTLTGGSIRVGGKIKTIHALLVGYADIAGSVDTKQGLKASKVVLRSGSRCEWPIVAGAVDVGQSYMNVGAWETEWMGQNISMRLVGKQTKVQDIYATDIHLGVACSAGKIFGQNIQIERGCVVDQITYTGKLKLPEDPKSAYIHHPPRKVDKLPTPPF